METPPTHTAWWSSDTTRETNQDHHHGGSAGGTAPTFTTLQEARKPSAWEKGAGAMLVSKPSNNVTDVIPG